MCPRSCPARHRSTTASSATVRRYSTRTGGPHIVYAWPIAEIAVMGADGAVNIAFKRKIKAAADPEAMRAQCKKEYEDRFLNPYVAASRGYVNEVIKPEETRDALLKALRGLKNKQAENPKKKHGNIPL